MNEEELNKDLSAWQEFYGHQQEECLDSNKDRSKKMSELLKINVNEHTEKKGNLTYLSWAWAWAEILKHDPQATWETHEFNGAPVCFLPDNSALVKVSVIINNHSKTCWLPVMDHRNRAITSPDAFAINTSIMRCLVKSIALHGLGLYIYAGEDLPEGEAAPAPEIKQNILGIIGLVDTLPDLMDYFKSLSVQDRQIHLEFFSARKVELQGE